MGSLLLIRWSFTLSAGLSVLKLFAGFHSHSLGVLASALDSLMDAGTSAINYFAFQMAASAPDREHPYGHGKVEALAGFVQGGMIGAGALALLAESLRRLWVGAHIHVDSLSLGVMGVGALVSAVHGRRLRRAASREHSAILRVEGFHFGVDLVSNLGVLAALAAVRLTGNVLWDFTLFGVMTAYILRESARVVRDAAEELIDQRLPPMIQSEIALLIRTHDPRIVGYHKFRTRKSGRKRFVDFHVSLRGVSDFKEAHEITESLIDKIESQMSDADVTVHYDPEGER